MEFLTNVLFLKLQKNHRNYHMKIRKEVNRPLSLPKDLMNRVGGHKSRKMSVIATKLGEVIITRKPDNYKIKYLVEIGRSCDIVPTAVLKVAGIDEHLEFNAMVVHSDIFISKTNKPTITVDEKKFLKPRILDI